MRITFTSIFLCLVFTAGSTILLGQNANGCSNGMRNGIHYTDCWTDSGDDTTRLQAAITAALNGRLVFNESDYTVSSALTVPAYRILEGTATSVAYSKSRITLTTSGTSSAAQAIFTLGPAVRGVTIRDLGLQGDTGTSYTVGIKASAPSTSSDGTYMTRLQGLYFGRLTTGISVNDPNSTATGWQFDNVHLEDTVFENVGTGVYVNAYNSGWQMNNIVFSSLSNQHGIHIERGAYISMNLIVGNGLGDGNNPPGPLSGKFLYIKEHGNIQISNSSSEGYKRHVELDGLAKSQPVVLTNNAFPACPIVAESNGPSIIIKNTNVVSTGNFYGCSFAPARPSVQGLSDVFSFGDKFCYEYSEWCNEHTDTTPNPDVFYPASEFALESSLAVLHRSRTYEYGDDFNPVEDILTSFPGKPLLELGNTVYYQNQVYKYKYSFKRNATDGWLEIAGSHAGTQTSPNTGLRFTSGPVQLTIVTQGSLSGYGSVAQNGSMLFCSDCSAGSTPCAASGSGALALKVGSQWHCK